MLQCEIVTTETGIEAIAGEWRQLHARLGRSPYTDYGWFRIWWDMLGKSHGARHLHIVVGRANGRLEGLLALTVVRRHGLRILHAAGHKAFYYCDMLAANAEDASVLWEAAWQSPHYDFADIRDVCSGTLGYEALSKFAHPRDITDSFAIRNTWDTSEEWLMSLVGHARGTFKRYTRRLQKKGTVSYEFYKAGPLPALLIDNMVREKIAWSIAREKHGLFDHPNVLPFFHRLLELAARQNALFLAWLKCGEDVIAYNLGFIHQSQLRMFFWTHNPQWSDCSPGNVILVNSINQAIDRGLGGIDLGHGGGTLKRQYANEMGECVEFTFACGAKRIFEIAFIGVRCIWRFLTRMKLEERVTLAKHRQENEG